MYSANNNNNNSDGGDEVAIVGIGFRIPSGGNGLPSELWNKLLNGFNGVVSTSERWNDNLSGINEISSNKGGLLSMGQVKSFDPLFFSISPSEAETIDPQQRLLLKCCWEALEDAMIDPLKIRGTNTPVFIGCSSNDYLNVNKTHTSTANPNIFGSTVCSVANRLSYCFDLHGESITLDTACSSSLNAVRLAYKSIKFDHSKLAIAGGVNFLIDPFISKSFNVLNMTSKSGNSLPFDANADGFVRAEGAGIIVMKRLKDAIADGNNVYCVINGTSSNVDSSGLSDKQSFYSPSKSSQSDNIQQALKSTNGMITANDIDFVEAHGTGTPIGDPIELEGISMALSTSKNRSSSNPLLVGSFKSNIGHCEAASGVMSLIKCCLMFKNQYFAPNINFKTPNPAIKFDEWNLKVITEPIPFPSNKRVSMAVNNFGVTGSNCCLILSQVKLNKSIATMRTLPKTYLIPFSANSNNSLQQYQSMVNLGDAVEFIQFVQQQITSKSIGLNQRSVIIASNWNEFNDQSNNIKTTNDKLSSNMSFSANKKNATMVFIFCGQGSQYQTMGKQLYDTEPIFKQSMDLLDEKLSKYYGFSVLNKLRSIPIGDNSIHLPFLAQPSLLMIHVSLFELYKHWGIKPSIIVGHSFGEMSAAYCSGMVDLDTICYLVYHRSIAQTKTGGSGKMLSINIGEEEFTSKYSTRYPTIGIACYNSPQSIVIAGNESILNEISSELFVQGIHTVMLGSLSSFHTSSQLMIKDEILNLQFNSSEQTIPIYSTVTSGLYNEGENGLKFNSECIFENILKPVDFSATISNLYKHIESNDIGSDIVFIELAPHPTLSFYLNQMIPKHNEYFKNGESISVYSPISKKKPNEQKEVQTLISKLYCEGYYNSIDFKSQISTTTTTFIELPLYQWDDQEYWKMSIDNENANKLGPPINHIGVSNSFNSPLYKSYQTFIDIKKTPFKWLKGHNVNSKHYFPGAGYIDIILNLFGQHSLTSNGDYQKSKTLPDILISFMEFKTPFILHENVNHCLQTNIYQTGKKEFKSLFHFKDEKTNQWVQGCGGNFQLFNSGSGNNEQYKYDIEDIISNQCNLTIISKEELYKKCVIFASLHYNGLFNSVEECYIGNNCSLSKVSLKLPLENQSSSFLFPSIIDCCFHGFIALTEYPGQYVFDHFEGLTYYSSNVPVGDEKSKHTHMYSLSTITSKQDNSYIANVVIFLSDGTVIMEIEKMVLTSTTPLKDPLTIEYPTNEMYSCYLQSKDSSIPTPSHFNECYKKEIRDSKYIIEAVKYKSFLSTILFGYINSRCPEITIDLIKSTDITQLKSKYCTDENVDKKHISRLFTFVFESLIEYFNCNNNLEQEQWNESNILNYQLFMKSTRIISKLLFPLPNDDLSIDTPQSLFEDGLLDEVYIDKEFSYFQNELLSEILQESIKPILNKKMVFRILEFGGGTCALSSLVLDKINSLLLQYPNYQIDIEYTWSDISPSFIPDAKTKLSKFNEHINIIYIPLNLEQPLIGDNQGLRPSYYDFIIMSNVLHVTKDIKYCVDQIYKLLTPNGHLLFVELNYNTIVTDSIFGVFDQWWSFEDTNIRKDRCCMKQETWLSLLKSCNFNSDIKMSNESTISFIIQAQKPSLLSSTKTSPIYDNTIIFGNNKSFINQIIGGSKTFKMISTIKEFKEISNSLTDKSIIYFIKPIDILDVNNFKEITHEYIQINQLLLQLNLKCKHILITCDSKSLNYLSSSIIGAARYFDEFKQLQLFTLNFDSISFQDTSNGSTSLPKIIDILTDPTIHIQREFIIKNHLVYFERYKNETKLSNNFISNSFESNDSDNIITKLDLTFDHQLTNKQAHLNANQVEVKVLSKGINYKDYLVYSGMIDSDLLGDTLNYGEMSGIVTRIGSTESSEDNTEFKVGDLVYGSQLDNKDHTIVQVDEIYRKPTNITHLQAASIPSIYITSYYSFYNVGSLKSNESILIHSATGGVGLASLEILKWKQHKGLIFCTVGSVDKQQYLIDNYGDMISGIYSTRNKDYVKQIKQKLMKLTSSKSKGGGIDLLLNTISSSDYMDSNFKCLNKCGRIVDLSITHLNSNEYMDNNKFKFNFGYHNVELLLLFDTPVYKDCLKIISNAIERNELKLIPIIEYSSENIKQAIEYINERKHIGKIVINYENHDTTVCKPLKLVKLDNDANYSSILKSDYHIQQSVLGKNIIITGQTGIVLEILKWIISSYSTSTIENIIILSKSSLKWELEYLIGKTTLVKNIKFHFKSIDIGNTELVDQSISEVLSDNPDITNIDSIFHFAFTPVVSNVNEISMNHLNISYGAKTMGAINLHNQSIVRGWKLINFVMASSIASVIGSSEQCSYVSACSVIDSLSQYRVSIGLPSICVNYGYIKSTGFVNRNESIVAYINGEGFIPISTNTILGSLDLQLQNQKQFTNSVICNFRNDFTIPQESLSLKFDYLFNITKQNKKIVNNTSNQTMLSEMIINKISELLSIESSKINQNIKLVDYGADSLVIVNLKNAISNELSIPNVISIQQLQIKSIKDSISIVKTAIDKNSKNNDNNLNDNGSFERNNNDYNPLVKGVEFWKNEINIVGDSLKPSIGYKPCNQKEESENDEELNVFLTGSTGFLGGYILSSLIKQSKCKTVYCLVRNKNKSFNPIDQVISNLKHHLLYDDLTENQLSKIIVIVGDLSLNEFGIDKKKYNTLSNNVNLIINSGADISLESDYLSNKISNVDGVKECIKLSISNVNPIKIATISTIYVFVCPNFNELYGKLNHDQFENIVPSIEDIDKLKTGYMQSKVIAEHILINSSKLYGFKSIIIRPPIIFANHQSGIGHEWDFAHLFFQSCYALKAYPIVDIVSLIHPVNWVSSNITNLILSKQCWSSNNNNSLSSTTNIYNVIGNPIQTSLVLNVFNTHYGFKCIEYEEWKSLMNKSNDQCCINLKSNITSLVLDNFKISKNLSISTKTKSLLKSFGSLCENDETGFSFTDKMAINHINYKFNK